MALTHKLNCHWFLCGDINTPAESWLNRNGSVVVCPELAQPIYPVLEPVKPIDYCVAPPGLHVEARHCRLGGLDHLSVMVGWDWPGRIGIG